MAKIKPKKWFELCPFGTKKGNEESKFFKSIARHPKYEWRSVAAISKESGLTKETVEKIIQKYFKLGVVFQNPKNEDHWGYWERVPQMLPNSKSSVSDEDKKNRIRTHLEGES